MTPFPLHALNPLLADIRRTPEVAPLEPHIVRLDRNEHVGPHAAGTVDAILSELRPSGLSDYPSAWRLSRKLAEAVSLPVERLTLVPGSDAAFRSLAHVLIQPGDRVAMIDPSYQMYPVYVRMFGGVPVPVPVREDLTVDPDALAAAARQAKVVWLANPNQPSGTLIASEQVIALVREASRTDTIVVVDEAYYPFSGSTVIGDVVQHGNLVVVRTFSKAHGLAGARVGFVAGPEPLVAALYKVRSSYDLNALAIAAATWMLDHPALVDEYVHETARSACLLQAVAARHGLWAPETATNFQLIRTAPRFDPAAIRQACLDEHYAIRGPVDSGRFAEFVRVTIGSTDVIAGFARSLDHIFQTTSVGAAAGPC